MGSPTSENIVTKADYQYNEVGNKPVLTAVLNYTNDAGKAPADKDVKYQIVIDKKVVQTRSAKTDALGSLRINIENDKRVNLSGSYIRTIINDVQRDFPIKASLTPNDIQFFPESGNLVAGLSSRVAFKAVGVDGLGTPITGKIVDEANNEVAQITTLHAGMGSFPLRSEAGKTYTAKITMANGTTKTVALPKVADDGYVLSVYQPNKDSILVRIGASAKQVAAAANVGFIARVSGETIFASPVKIAKATTSIWLEKKLFPSGIAQFTLFSNTGEPLNERIAFIRTNDHMQLNVKTAKTTYKGREQVAINLDAKDSKGKSVAGTFSVAVIDESKVPVDESAESSIFSNILLTSDLKGYIEKPNYYFANQTEDADKALDNLMLTQGYRRFAWKEIAAGTIPKPAFAAEGLGFGVSGQVMNLGKKVSPNATVDLVSLRAGIAKKTTADAEGRFKFDGIFLTDSVRFAVQARSATGSDKVKILLDTLPRLRMSKNPNMGDISTNITGTLKAYIENGKKLDDIYEKTGQLDKVQRLKEVRIKARRIKEDANINPQGMFRVPEASADQVVKFGDDAANCVTLAMCLQARIAGVRVETNPGYTKLISSRGAMGLILDGRRIDDPDQMSEILDGGVQPEDVAKIVVVRTNQALINTLGGDGNGYLLIMLKTGTSRKQYNPSIANISPKGFNKVREFYSPKYDQPNPSQLPDLRTTVYWDPRVKTDTEGKSTFTFFNADGPGSYKVIVEGINAAGELGRQVYRYTVQ
ncbi:carboxypeptidase regulatory-like domain-containing protein [Mucilaginibacter sp. S1162]|uniref:Carboxypeptidase regulatory-like domain-containing protein n=1 Tax=Mucilaginibacter humi TaxID=2732510 RepID=A0ABX1W2S7_9SPHI|nr:carboxypeptidase-like regulatory domain-containing protein [Mucilaginibacter humi]NNU34435.1 carboxypeptidase regulatory-like domain-containing protein [Mucilaginibacter humi]